MIVETRTETGLAFLRPRVQNAYIKTPDRQSARSCSDILKRRICGAFMPYGIPSDSPPFASSFCS
jgi:hypothetical protein